MKSMEIDGTNESSETIMSGNDIHLTPVSQNGSGEGLPYAPINWPKPGDNWRWKVGKRVSNNGYFRDRYLYLPKHIHCFDNSASKKPCFGSKLSVEQYIRTAFPDADLNAFFSSFSWKIPSKQLLANGVSPQTETEKVEKEKEHITHVVKRKIKHTAAASSVKRLPWQSRRQAINDAGDTMESHSRNKGEAASESPSKDMKNTTGFDDYLFADNSPSPENDLPAAQMLGENKVKLTSLSNKVLGENKAKLTSPRKDVNELKANVLTLLQKEIDSDLLAVQGIDDQIAQLQSRRAELMSTIDTKKKMAKFKLTDS